MNALLANVQLSYIYTKHGSSKFVRDEMEFPSVFNYDPNLFSIV